MYYSPSGGAIIAPDASESRREFRERKFHGNYFIPITFPYIFQLIVFFFIHFFLRIEYFIYTFSQLNFPLFHPFIHPSLPGAPHSCLSKYQNSSLAFHRSAFAIVLLLRPLSTLLVLLCSLASILYGVYHERAKRYRKASRKIQNLGRHGFTTQSVLIVREIRAIATFYLSLWWSSEMGKGKKCVKFAIRQIWTNSRGICSWVRAFKGKVYLQRWK